MNNERYLFRGMRKGEPHEFIYGDLNYISGDVYVIDRGNNAPLNSFDWSEVIPETVGQFTGLMDKNGMKVFEGDIIQSPEASVSHEIVWDQQESRFALRRYPDTCWGGTMRLMQEWVTQFHKVVIGNIHNNIKKS